MICANDFNPLSHDGAINLCANEIATSGKPSMAQRAPMNAIGAFHWRTQRQRHWQFSLGRQEDRMMTGIIFPFGSNKGFRRVLTLMNEEFRRSIDGPNP